MQADPCEVCSRTELKLIDGYYYCVECGTQNTNVRETVVEQKALGDGNFALATRRKIVKLHDSKIQMSPEWYKWHAYNFIIMGLADELVAAGAKHSFKLKLLWIWTRYIKKYQNKAELGVAKPTQDKNNEDITLPSFMFEENSSSNPVLDEEDEIESEVKHEETTKKLKNKYDIMDGSYRDIRFLSKGVIIAMLYLALNLDESDIQLSHLFRFIKEKHVNFSNVQRFVPNDIHVKSLQERWTSFLHSKVCNMHNARVLAMSLLRKLDLGTPRVPDLRKIVDNILMELCLPNDIKPMIFSLMHFHHCDFLDMSNKTKEHLVKMPDYEGVVMSYVLVALKMCFGLDGDYEETLSNAVEKINDERDLLRSYKIGKYSEPSTRLFSFREWCSYMQFRKITLCKSCLYMTQQHSLDIDDYVYLEHMSDRPQNNKDLQDETAMDLIKKIPGDDEGRVIPKNLFLPTLTPMTEYTEIIIEHSQDQETKFLLSEDFTQYSLKYACEYLRMVDINAENIIKGVSENRKIVSNVILGTIVTKKSKTEMVYVKNCENINWMKTNPPTMEHVICDDLQNISNDKESDHLQNITNDKESDHLQIISNDKESDHLHNITNDKESDYLQIISNDKESHLQNISNDKESDLQNISNDKESDHGYDSENPVNEKEVTTVIENTIDDTDQSMKEDKKAVIIREEDAEKNIFDDLFEELDLKDEMERNNMEDLNNDQPLQNNDTLHDDRASISDMSEYAPTFDPDTFDREQTIKELILNACKKYKITIPAEYKIKAPRKRKNDTDGGPREYIKRAKTNRFESKRKVDELLHGYYSHMQSDLLSKMQEEVSLAIRNAQLDSVLNVTQNETANATIVEQTGDALSIRSSIIPGSVENQSNVNPQISVLEQNDNNKEQNPDKTNVIDDIDENWEAKLFEDDKEIKLDDLIPKGDPKFDEEKYDINQLYIKFKAEGSTYEEDICNLQDDPKLELLLNKKIEEFKNSTELEKLKAESVVNPVKTKYESDSDDDIPLNVIQEEKKRIEEMISWEENFDPLINAENVSEFKYWFRHYEKKYMTRSMDLHKNFDEELKENTPSSFYFVIRECASILNSSTFYLYKHMQNLEKYIIAKAKCTDW